MEVAAVIVSVAAVIVSVLAMIPGFIARREAKAAHQMAERTESRATETHDVEWTIGYVDEHHLFLRNEGLSEARAVQGRIELPGESFIFGAELVEPWAEEVIPCDVSFSRYPAGARVFARVLWSSKAGLPHRASIRINWSDVLQAPRRMG